MSAGLALLFVDDEPNVLQGIRRLTRQQRDRWEMHFAESGEDALLILRETDIDVVVADIRMPGMDGTELLRQVKVTNPSIVRIILSGYAEEETLFRSTRVAHRFLHKPCELGELEQTIDEIVQTRRAVSSHEVMELVGRIDQLPALGEVYEELAAAVERDNWSPQGLARIVSQDVSLTVELLRLVKLRLLRAAAANRVGRPGRRLPRRRRDPGRRGRPLTLRHGQRPAHRRRPDRQDEPECGHLRPVMGPPRRRNQPGGGRGVPRRHGPRGRDPGPGRPHRHRRSRAEGHPGQQRSDDRPALPRRRRPGSSSGDTSSASGGSRRSPSTR